MVYSPKDVRRIVEFGLEHGVMVLTEIDAPWHTGPWAAAYPEIVVCANMFWWPAGSNWDDRLASEPGNGRLKRKLGIKYFFSSENRLNQVLFQLFPQTFP